jgi:hypothetical protein
MIAFYLQLKSVLSLIMGYLILNIYCFLRTGVKLCSTDDTVLQRNSRTNYIKIILVCCDNHRSLFILCFIIDM